MVSTQPERQQREFDVLASLFDPVVLQKNTAKTVGMVCQPYHEPDIDGNYPFSVTT